MSAESRRSSSSSSTQTPSTPSSGPSTPTGKSPPFGSNFSRYTGSTKRKLNPVRRCQSMKNPNASMASIVPPVGGLRSRRVSSTPSSLENGKSHAEMDFVKYYQYKTNRRDLSLPFNIMITNNLDGLKDQNKCRVLVLGAPSSGKTSLIRQFDAYIDEQIERESDITYFRTNYSQENEYRDHNGNVKRNGEAKPILYLNFKEATSLGSCYPRSPLTVYQPDAYIVVYGVNSRESFESAKKIISEIFKWDDVETKPIILVANKTDLVRSRIISKQEGRQLAITNNCKYIETSCAISHNVDFLLAGIGAQINLKTNSKQCSNNGRKPNIIKRFLNKAVLKKSKSCDNLHVL